MYASLGVPEKHPALGPLQPSPRIYPAPFLGRDASGNRAKVVVVVVATVFDLLINVMVDTDVAVVVVVSVVMAVEIMVLVVVDSDGSVKVVP
ncbi:MAG: hypothetical protein M1387_01435 [Thaumarchaeota archaeon]|nr:hypothetical protein [Nitrososphaerota archaeon]